MHAYTTDYTTRRGGSPRRALGPSASSDNLAEPSTTFEHRQHHHRVEAESARDSIVVLPAERKQSHADIASGSPLSSNDNRDKSSGNDGEPICVCSVPLIVTGKTLRYTENFAANETVLIHVDVHGVLLAGSDLQVRNAVPMSNLASWAVDGDNFKIQRIAPALGRIFVDTFLTGFEQAQRLQAYLVKIAEAHVTGAAARMIHIHPRLAVGDAFPSSLRPAINSSRFGIGIFLDPRLRGQPIEKTLEDAMKQAETAGAGDMEKQIRNLIQQAVLLDGADSFAEKLVALTMAGVQASRRRVMLELQEKNGIPSSVSCPNCKDKSTQLTEQANTIQTLEDELCKVRNQNAVLQTEIEELSRTLEASSQDDLGAPLAASMAHIARLEAENKQLVAELNESDRLVQRQMKSIAELENRLPESPRLGSSSFRSTSPRPSSSAVAISDNRALLLEISAHLHHGLGALRADTEALRQDAEVLRRVFPQAVGNLQVQIGNAVATVQESEQAAIRFGTQEAEKRRRLHNELVDVRGAIRCIARLRPMSDEESQGGQGPAVWQLCGPGKVLQPRLSCTDGLERSFEFDQVLGPEIGQEETYAEVGPLVQSALDGYNVCVLAYGQTGAGKTFTMEGSISAPGIAGQAISDLFRLANERQVSEFTVTMSVLEVYNDTLRDQLAENGAGSKLEVKQARDGQVFIPDLTSIEVTSAQEVASLMRTARRNRATFATNLNKHSSRSHSILSIRVVGRCTLSRKVTVGKLQLVDLAGSERTSKLDADAERLKETTFINRSLSALGDVLFSLGKKAGHVPFRNSKLTYVLQDSLCPGSKVLMLMAVSPAPESLKESINTLTFGMRIRGVELGHASQTIYVDATGAHGSTPESPGQQQPQLLRSASSPTHLSSPGPTRPGPSAACRSPSPVHPQHSRSSPHSMKSPYLANSSIRRGSGCAIKSSSGSPQGKTSRSTKTSSEGRAPR